MRTYLAGPMTGIPNFNYPLFKEVVEYLRKHDYEMVCPTEAVNNIEGTLPYHECLQKDLAALLTCRRIFMLPGWNKSRGATLEVFLGSVLNFAFGEIRLRMNEDERNFDVWMCQIAPPKALIYLVGAWFPVLAKGWNLNTD